MDVNIFLNLNNPVSFKNPLTNYESSFFLGNLRRRLWDDCNDDCGAIIERIVETQNFAFLQLSLDYA